MQYRPFILLVCSVLLCACGDEANEATPADGEGPAATDARERELRKTRALDAVGYDGSVVEKNLRRTLERTDERADETEAARRALDGQ